MKRYIEILRKTVSVIVVTFLFVQFFTVSPLISEENGSDTNITENQTTETVDNNEKNTNNTDPSSGDVNNENNDEVTPGDNTDPSNPTETGDVTDPNDNTDPNKNNDQSDVTENTGNNPEVNPNDNTDANNKDVNEIEYDVFTKTINDITITLKTNKGVFPEGTTLFAEEVSNYQKRQIDSAIEEIKEEDINVVSSYCFDIKMLDSEGNEIQPNEGESVQISFTASEVENANLNTNVYHIEENDSEITASSLEVITEGDTATVETNSFSYYSIEFYYGTLKYLLAVGQEIDVSTILRFFGFANTNVVNASVDTPAIQLTQEGVEWRIKGIDVFDTATLIVELNDGNTYNIQIKCDGIDNKQQIANNNIIQGGSADTAGGDSFVKDMPIQSISILDLSKIAPTLEHGTNSYLVNSGGSFSEFTASTANTGGWGGTVYYGNRLNNPTSSFNPMTGDPTYKVGISSGGSPKTRKFLNGYYYYRFKNAAILPDGTTADVLVKFSDIYNYSTGSLGWVLWSNYSSGSYPSLWPYSKDGQVLGLQANVTVMVVDTGTQKPVDTSSMINGNYFYTVRGIDILRSGSPYNNSSIESVGNYSNPVDRNTARPNYLYSESVEVDRTTSVGSIYIPQVIESSLFIDDSGRFVATTNQSSDPYAPGPDSYGTGFATIGKTSGTTVTAYSSARNDMYESLDSDYRGIFFMTPISHTSSASTGANGSISLWDDGVAYSDNATIPAGVNQLMTNYSENTSRIFSIPNGKEVTYKLIPDSGYSLRVLRVNGSIVTPIGRDANGNVVANENEIKYYTYTFPSSVTTDQVLYVEWSGLNSDCVDCKNYDACDNCYLAKEGKALHNYKLEEDGAYRGGEAASKVGSIVLDIEDTFAQPLPYGNIYIDVSKLVWNDPSLIDIPDSRFKITANTTTPLSTHNSFVSISNNNGYNDPIIAYYGPLHSYLMYGTEKSDTEPASGQIRQLGRYDRTNVAGSKDIIADGIYTVNEGDQDYSVDVINGTNVITPENGNDYLYRITYKDAAVLQDGSRGDLVLTTTKVEIESSYTPDIRAYIGLQKPNEMTINASYIKPGSPGTGDAYRYIPNSSDGVLAQDGNPQVTGINARNAVGEKITFTIEATRSDGSPVNGVISYGVKDLDWSSWQSVWGRVPDYNETYASNGGTDPDIINDEIRNTWTGTHKFYEYGEGLAINSGALSYALVPSYSHDKFPYNYNNGSLPINELLRDLRNLDGLYGGMSDDDFNNNILYNSPIQVIATVNKAPGDYTANGLKFVTTSSIKYRNSNGIFTYGDADKNPKVFNQDGSENREFNGTDNTYARVIVNNKRDKYTTNRADGSTYDTGFAVLLDASGSELTWSGSYHTNQSINTTLFDSSFAQYIHLSHGTGGGIYVEDYDMLNNCNTIYRENLVTIPTGSSIRSTIVPEDGYRVNKITIDDIKISVNYDENDNPISLTFESDVQGQINNATLDSNNKYTKTVSFTGDTVSESLKSQYTTVSNNSGNLAEFTITITKNDDGIFDVDLFNRKYNEVGDTTGHRHNLHADFDTFYYFTKIWVDAASASAEDIPTSLTFVASPYVMQHNEVTVGNKTYEIEVKRTMHLDTLDSNGDKVKYYNLSAAGTTGAIEITNANISNYHDADWNLFNPGDYVVVGGNMKYDINADGILLTISGNRQKYPAVEVKLDTDSDGTLETTRKYVIINDSAYLLNNAGDAIDQYHNGDRLDNPIPISRGDDGYYVALGGSELSGNATNFLLHHIQEISYISDNETVKTTDNPDYGDVVYVAVGNRPQKPYSKIELNGDTYIITGDFLHKVEKNSKDEWIESTPSVSIPITHKFERFNEGTYINKKTFTVRTDADVNATGTDITNQLNYAAAQSKYVTTEWINNGQDLVWKIKYPAQGLDVDGSGISENGVDWPALSIETEHIYDDMHEIATDHVERLYWFANERLGTLNGKWALDGYTNTDAKVLDNYSSNSEVPGYASYRDSNGNIKYITNYWYLLATEDRDEVEAELADMADLRMAFMSPISEETIKRSSYGSYYEPNSYYTEYGGVIVNSIHQTKLLLHKNWIGGDSNSRTPYKIIINRDYNYSQPKHSDLEGVKAIVTLPDGQTFNRIMTALVGGKPRNFIRFRNGTEPLSLNKDIAIEVASDSDIANIDPTKLIVIKNNSFGTGETKEANVYFWYEGDTDGTVYMWTDADEVYLNEDASRMFYNFEYLQQISGVHIFNTSGTKNMSYMFAIPDGYSGSITNLYNLRDWDTRNVTNMDHMFYRQLNLDRIHGIIDWNLSSCDNFEKMFTNDSGAHYGEHPFIWYPNVYIDGTGSVVDPNGNPLTTAHSKTNDGTARDLIWDSEDLSNLHEWWNNGINTPTNFNDNSAYTTWEWEINDDFLKDPSLSYSDASKWSYRVYEENKNNYLNGYSSLENATSLGNAVDFIYNPDSGYLEASLTNVQTTDVIVEKKTAGNDDGEFRFRIKFDSLYEPDDKIEVAKENTIVVVKRFVDEDGVYLDLSENNNDYYYEGKEFKLTLYKNGTGDNPSSYQSFEVGSAFPEGWTKYENGTWTYTFENIDDENVQGYLISEPTKVNFRYKGDTVTSTFSTQSSSAVRKVPQDKNSSSYHTVRYTNVSTAGERALIQKANSDDISSVIGTEYTRGDGYLLERYISFDGEQYDVYDVLIKVDKDENVKRNTDGSLEDMRAFYGGAANGYKIDFDYPYSIYTDQATGSAIPIETLNYPTYDQTTHTVKYVDDFGLHTFTPTHHKLERTEIVSSSQMSYEDAAADTGITEINYVFNSPTNDYYYKFVDIAWKQFKSSDDTVVAEWTGTNPPNNSTTTITKYRTFEVWNRNISNRLNPENGYDPKYSTTGTYKVTDPETGISEEYYIVEQEGGVVSAEHTVDGTQADLGDIISNINFDAENGTADFTTSDGIEYKFSKTGIEVIENVWEFNLKKDETFTIENIPLGTTYEVWEYDYENGWSLIDRDTKTNDGKAPTASTTNRYEGGGDLNTIKKYTLSYAKDQAGTYYKLIDNFEPVSSFSGDETEYETYTNDISILVRYRHDGYKEDDEGTWYKKADGEYTQDVSQAIDSNRKFKPDYVRDNSNKSGVTYYYKRLYKESITTADKYEKDDNNAAIMYKKDYIESNQGTYYKLNDGTNPPYTNVLPIAESHLTSAGLGGIERFIGLSEVIKHTFTNEKDSFSLTVDKTVKGNQGSKDQYFKFTIDLSNIEKGKILTLDTNRITKSFSFKEDDNGEYYRYKDGRYVLVNDVKLTTDNASIFVGYDKYNPTDLTKIKRYKAIKPNLATNFINYIMSNNNNRDDDIAQRIEPLNGDYLTYKEAKENNDIDEIEYIFEVENNEYPNHSTKYIYDSDNNTWVKFTWNYIQDITGESYYNTSDNTYLDGQPDKANIIYYAGYVESNVKNNLKRYSLNTDNEYVEDPDGIYYKLADGTGYEPYDNNHLLDYEGAYEYALSILTTYKPGYDNEDVTENQIPENAIYRGIDGQQVITGDNGKATVTVYMKHGEAVTIDGLPMNAKYTITEEIDGLEDYKTSITDINGENEEISRITTGIIGTKAIEDPDGKYYKVNETVWSLVKNNIQDNIKDIKNKKYKKDYVLSENGIWYKKNSTYTTVQPTANTVDTYDSFDNALLERIIKKYVPNYLEDSDGTWYKLDDGTYTQTAPTEETIVDYDGYTEETIIDDIKKYRIDDYTEDGNGTYYKLNDGTYTETKPTTNTYNNYADYDVNDVVDLLKTIKYSYDFVEDVNGTYYKLSNPDYLVNKEAIDSPDVIIYIYYNNTWYKFNGEQEDTEFDGSKSSVPSGLTFYTTVEPTLESAANYDGFNSVNVNNTDFKLIDADNDSITYRCVDGIWKKFINGDEDKNFSGSIDDIPASARCYGADSMGISNRYERISDYYLDYLESGDINNIKKYKMVYTERPNGIYYLKDGVYTIEAPKISFVTYYKGDDTYYETSNYIIYYRLVSDDSYTTDGSGQTREYYSIDGVPNRYIKVGNDYIRIENETYYKKTDGSYTTKEPRENDLWHYEAYDGSAAKYYVGYTDDQHLKTIKKYEDGYIPDDSGSYIKQNYTWDTPTSNYDKYVGYDGSDPNSITKYSPSFTEADNGDFIKNLNGHFESVLNINNNPNNYEGYDGSNIESIKRYNFVRYIEYSNGQAYKFVEPQYLGGSYSISYNYEEELTAYDLRNPIDEDRYIVNTLVKYKIADDPTKVYYQLITGDYTTTPPSIDGSDLNSIKRYKVDFVEDPNGTFYRVKTNSSAIEEGYTETSPKERYYDFTTYSLNVTAKYTNTRDGIVPTKAFAGYFMPLIILNSIALCYVLYDRKRNKDRLADE